MRSRDSYTLVGTSTRLAIERAMPGLTLPEARVLLALVVVLTSWSRCEDTISARQLSEMTGMDERAVRRAAASLDERQAIEREASRGRRASLYRLPNPGDTNPGPDDHWSSGPGLSALTNPGPADPPTLVELTTFPRSSPEDDPEEAARVGERPHTRADLVDLARGLLTAPEDRLRPGELVEVLDELEREHGLGPVRRVVDDLADAGWRRTYPRHLRSAVRERLESTSKHPAAQPEATPCGAPWCDGLWHTGDNPVTKCPGSEVG